jgi:hypothetical protein
MKTYRNLYPQVCAFENLYRAYRAARKGKRGKDSVAAFEREQERELLQLQDELLDETYTPGPYHSFYIHEPKRRPNDGGMWAVAGGVAQARQSAGHHLPNGPGGPNRAIIPAWSLTLSRPGNWQRIGGAC